MDSPTRFQDRRNLHARLFHGASRVVLFYPEPFQLLLYRSSAVYNYTIVPLLRIVERLTQFIMIELVQLIDYSVVQESSTMGILGLDSGTCSVATLLYIAGDEIRYPEGHR